MARTNGAVSNQEQLAAIPLQLQTSSTSQHHFLSLVMITLRCYNTLIMIKWQNFIPIANISTWIANFGNDQTFFGIKLQV